MFNLRTGDVAAYLLSSCYFNSFLALP